VRGERSGSGMKRKGKNEKMAEMTVGGVNLDLGWARSYLIGELEHI